MNTPTLDLTGSIPLVNGVPVYPIFGSTTANYGITHSGDLLVSRLRDGTNLNEIWEDAVAALAEFNKNRISIVNLLSYQTTNSADAVYQNLTVPSFEQASEFGVSKSIAPPAEVLLSDLLARTGIYVRNSLVFSCVRRIVAKSTGLSTPRWRRIISF